ncbi:MAG TPA: hypothetical protein VMQ86_06770 [Bryobacteraceae bacterium]|nr:hypothetical protein [Bryobacteraceae bacterium]
MAKWLWGEGSEGVTEDEKMEFWSGLGRLYDETLALREAAGHLADAARAHQAVAEAHERRLDKLEVVQQWLAEKERARERGERL